MIPDVSIIVPCYNVAAYVDSCLDSLVRQTLRNIEIICINDGSTDETWIHLLRWKEKDSRIILLNQRNAGVSAARNAGLDAARGLYVGFADPDDYMDPEMYSRLFSAALEYDADIVECGNHVFEDSSDRLIEAKRRSPSRHFEENASPASFFRDSIWGKMDICVWSKLFRKSMLDAHRLRFNVHLKSGAEDETFRLMAVPHASRLLFIPDCLYYYRLMRNGSLSRRCNVPTYSKCVQEFQRLLYIVDYWQKQGWQNEGLFAYGVRKIRPFFCFQASPFPSDDCCPATFRAGLVEPVLSEGGRKTFPLRSIGTGQATGGPVELGETGPQRLGAHSAGSLLPASRTKRTLLLLQKNACGTFFPSLPQWVSKRKRFSGRAV